MNNIFLPSVKQTTLEPADQDTNGSTYQYFGFLSISGSWIIQRFDLSVTDVISYRYAVSQNNSNVKYYTAWSNRSSLNYGYIDSINI